MVTLSWRQRLEGRMARALVELPPAVRRGLVGAPITRDGHTLDEQVQFVLWLERKVRPHRPANPDVASARRELEGNGVVFAAPSPLLESVEDLRLACAAGERAARFYRPRGAAAAAPALVFFHGGGFVVGSLDTHDAVCRVLAARARAVVISVDYRLAPEHPFPAAADDAVAAFRSVAREAARFGVDPARIAVGGDSAGGNLAAVVAQQTRADAKRPCFQLLVYPAVDMTMSFPSIRSLGAGFLLEKSTIDWYRAHYLPAGTDPRDPRASPLFARAEDLAGLPPAFVLTAGFDPLRDEGDAYAARLGEAGVAVKHRCYGGLFHGFLNVSGSIRAARQPLDDIVAALTASFSAGARQGGAAIAGG